MLFKDLKSFYYDYELPLARLMCRIDNRGMLVDVPQLMHLEAEIIRDLNAVTDRISTALGRPVGYDAETTPKGGFNLGSHDQLKAILVARGMKIPIDRKTHRETTGEQHLFRLFGQTGDRILEDVLKGRELNKVKSTYINVKLYKAQLFCTFKVTGTVTGRRSSAKYFADIGTNHQNLPKYSKWGKLFRKCIVARPGKIFVACDQKGAEDWIVNAIIADNGGSLTGINELRAGINRHRKLASLLFSKPESECTKDTLFYLLGKKTRHAGNYDVYGKTMSEALAKEGFSFPPKDCQNLLDAFHAANSDVRNVFHAYVKDSLCRTRKLSTPIGRQRVFLALRSFSDNSEVFRDAFSYIPQSTVGDNTGLALLDAERLMPDCIVSESHDSIVMEVNDELPTVARAVEALENAFCRELIFPTSGFKIEIPVEFEIGYSLGDMVSCENLTDLGLQNTYHGLNRVQRAQLSITGGAPLLRSQLHCVEAVGSIA